MIGLNDYFTVHMIFAGL